MLLWITVIYSTLSCVSLTFFLLWNFSYGKDESQFCPGTLPDLLHLKPPSLPKVLCLTWKRKLWRSEAQRERELGWDQEEWAGVLTQSPRASAWELACLGSSAVQVIVWTCFLTSLDFSFLPCEMGLMTHCPGDSVHVLTPNSHQLADNHAWLQWVLCMFSSALLLLLIFHPSQVLWLPSLCQALLTGLSEGGLTNSVSERSR
jgi:hypothetical protein